jgi:hypothetical protein
MKKWLAVLAAIFVCSAAPAMAQANKKVIPTCGGVTMTVGEYTPGTVDTTGAECVTGGASGTVTPGSLTLVPLDVSTVTTGGTAVTALTAGHRTKGGFLVNPENATINLCINEQAAASGTVSAAALVCIAPSQAYTLAPSSLGVSVVTSDSAHPFAGQGYN